MLTRCRGFPNNLEGGRVHQGPRSACSGQVLVSKSHGGTNPLTTTSRTQYTIIIVTPPHPGDRFGGFMPSTPPQALFCVFIMGNKPAKGDLNFSNVEFVMQAASWILEENAYSVSKWIAGIRALAQVGAASSLVLSNGHQVMAGRPRLARDLPIT